MRILAMETEISGVKEADFLPFLEAEARMVWQLQQDDIIREIYFRADKTTAVLILECDDVEDANQRLSKLPLVLTGLIEFQLIPLVPYPGFSRLFVD